MRKVGLILLLFCFLVVPAQAHLVKHYSKGMSWHMREHRHTLNLAHAAYVCKYGTGLVKRQHCKGERWLKQLLTPPIAHWSLWNCIHGGEGNGYNGSYTGWLGMTTPWMGHYPPGSDWVHSSQSAVYAIAEQEYKENRYSLKWLRGQWPRTSLACI